MKCGVNRWEFPRSLPHNMQPCCICAASCMLEAGTLCTNPKMRTTADLEVNQENLQCVSLNVVHSSKRVNRVIFPLGFWQAAVRVWPESLQSSGSHGVHCFSCSISSKPLCEVILVNFSFSFHASFICS